MATPSASCAVRLCVCEKRDGWLVAWGMCGHADSFLQSATSPFHSFVITWHPPVQGGHRSCGVVGEGRGGGAQERQKH